MVQFLIEKGANDYNNALRRAATGKYQEMIHFLVEQGIDGYEVFRKTVIMQSWEMVHLLVEKGADDYNGALWSAAHGGQAETVLFLMKQGADDYSGALQVAAEAYQDAVARDSQGLFERGREWLNRRQRGLTRVIKLLEKKIRELEVEGSEMACTPDNDSTLTEDAAHHESESTQQDGLNLGPELDQEQKQNWRRELVEFILS